jgi:hypothetical protein
VDGIEQDVSGRAVILRLDLLSDAGAAIARRYGVEYTPTFVVFDRRGEAIETLRGVDRTTIAARLLELAG